MYKQVWSVEKVWRKCGENFRRQIGDWYQWISVGGVYGVHVYNLRKFCCAWYWYSNTVKNIEYSSPRPNSSSLGKAHHCVIQKIVTCCQISTNELLFIFNYIAVNVFQSKLKQYTFHQKEIENVDQGPLSLWYCVYVFVNSFLVFFFWMGHLLFQEISLSWKDESIRF